MNCLRLVGAGAEKLIYTLNSASQKSGLTRFFSFLSSVPHYAYCIPRHFWNKRSVKEEAFFAQTLKHTLKQKGLSDDYLAVDLQPSTLRIKGRLAFQMQCAEGSLDKEILKPNLTFSQRSILGLQFLKGLSQLHAAGCVHGDLKLENVLIFKKGRATVAKLADWGKAEWISEDQHFIYTGARQIAPNEFLRWKKGEVFSAGVGLVRIFEEAILSSTSQKRLLDPLKIRRFPIPHKERGIIDYLCSNAEMSSSHFRSKRILGALFRKTLPYQPSRSELNDQKLLHKYVDALESALVKQRCCSKNVAANVCSLIKRMTLADPFARPTALEAAEKLDAIVPKWSWF